MYEELVKSLRLCVSDKRGNGCASECSYGKKHPLNYWCMDYMLMEAADAIEELKKVANKLLAKYEEEATSVIWEYSGKIEEDIDCLNEEVRTLMAQINGMPLPEPPKEET